MSCKEIKVAEGVNQEAPQSTAQISIPAPGGPVTHARHLSARFPLRGFCSYGQPVTFPQSSQRPRRGPPY